MHEDSPNSSFCKMDEFRIYIYIYIYMYICSHHLFYSTTVPSPIFISSQSSPLTPFENCKTTKSTLLSPITAMGECHVPAAYVTACPPCAQNALRLSRSGGPRSRSSSGEDSVLGRGKVGATTTRYLVGESAERPIGMNVWVV